MIKLNKVFEIVTDSKDGTNAASEMLANTDYYVCKTTDWGSEGAELTVMTMEVENK